MYVEYHRVAAGNHADGIVDDGFGGVGGGGDGGDDTEGSVFLQHQARIPGQCLRSQAFGAGGLVDDGKVLFHLVLVPAHARFLHDLPAPLLDMGPGAAADRFNNAAAVLNFEIGHPFPLGLPGRFHGIVHILEHAVVAGGVDRCRRGGYGALTGVRGLDGGCAAGLHTRKHLLDNRINFLRCNIHGILSFPGILASAFPYLFPITRRTTSAITSAFGTSTAGT